jgi:UDP-GlcNAc:undecaprenyl-phosphate GlcNAc-1-phosphate transferase
MVVGAYGLLSAVLVGGYPLARRWGWRLHKTMRPGEMSDLTQQVLGRKVWLLRIIYLLVTSLVLVLSTVGSVVPSRLAIDFAVFGLAISLCSLVGRLMRLSLTPVLQRLTIYTCAILSIFALDESSILGDVLADPDVISHGIIALAVLIAIGVRNTESKYFAVTPSDYLVMAILVAAAFLPEFRNLNYTKLVMESAVLLYGVEYVLRQHGKSALLLWGASIGVFATHGYRVLV